MSDELAVVADEKAIEEMSELVSKLATTCINRGAQSAVIGVALGVALSISAGFLLAKFAKKKKRREEEDTPEEVNPSED